MIKSFVIEGFLSDYVVDETGWYKLADFKCLVKPNIIFNLISVRDRFDIYTFLKVIFHAPWSSIKNNNRYFRLDMVTIVASHL